MPKKQIPEAMQSTINFHTESMTWVGGVSGLAGAGADVPLLATSWVTMTIDLAQKAGHSFDSEMAKELTMVVATSIGISAFGMKAASMAIGWVGAIFTGGISLAVSAGANIALNRSLTRRYGQAAAIYFLETTEISNTKTMAERIYQIFLAKSGTNYAFNP